MPMAELTVIFRTHSDVEASVVRGLLESHGIQSVASSDVPHAVFPLSIDGLGEVRIAVRDDEAESARRLIANHRAAVTRAALVPIREEFKELEDRLGHAFRDRGLLEHALTHRSGAHEDASGGVADNESLEFLGDSVLGLVVADLLFRELPHSDEGDKSKLMASLVSAPALGRLGQRLGLGDHLILGRGEERSGGRKKQGLVADAFEAVVAALYLDGGLEVARTFLERELRPLLDDLMAGGSAASRDHKSTLQEWLQKHGEPLPEYRVTAERGPDHDKVFEIEVWVGDRMLARSTGRSKQAAEQAAAHEALARTDGATSDGSGG